MEKPTVYFAWTIEGWLLQRGFLGFARSLAFLLKGGTIFGEGKKATIFCIRRCLLDIIYNLWRRFY